MAIWVGTAEKGIARFRKSTRSPQAPSVVVQTDRDYTDLAALPRLLTGQRVTFKFKAVDFRTVPEKRQYRWQLLQGARSDAALAKNWQPPGFVTELEHSFQQPGAWTLAVELIDRDLHYSKPTLAVLNVVVPWHANMAVMVPAGAGVVGLLGWAFIARLM